MKDDGNQRKNHPQKIFTDTMGHMKSFRTLRPQTRYAFGGCVSRSLFNLFSVSHSVATKKRVLHHSSKSLPFHVHSYFCVHYHTSSERKREGACLNLNLRITDYMWFIYFSFDNTKTFCHINFRKWNFLVETYCCTRYSLGNCKTD